MRAQNVMAGLVPAIHVFVSGYEVVDARNKCGHDGVESVGHPSPVRFVNVVANVMAGLVPAIHVFVSARL
jgi:hypothetical protein